MGRDRGREASNRTERGLPAFWLLYLAAVVGEGFGGLKSASVPELRIPFSLRAGEEGLPSKSYIVPRGPPLFLLLLFSCHQQKSLLFPNQGPSICGAAAAAVSGDFWGTKIAHPGPKRPLFLCTTLGRPRGKGNLFSILQTAKRSIRSYIRKVVDKKTQ